MPAPRDPSPRPFARFPPSPPRKSGPVLAVGGRVVVAKRVTLTGNDNTTPLATVAEGVEVEILAWQPGGAHGTRYRVLSPKDRVEGWLGASSLKPRPQLPSPKAEAPRAQRPPAAAERAPTKVIGRSAKRTKSK